MVSAHSSAVLIVLPAGRPTDMDHGPCLYMPRIFHVSCSPARSAELRCRMLRLRSPQQLCPAILRKRREHLTAHGLSLELRRRRLWLWTFVWLVKVISGQLLRQRVQRHLCGKWPYCWQITCEVLRSPIHATSLHQWLGNGQRLAPRLRSSMHEGQVLHAAVVRALEIIEPLRDHGPKFCEAFLRREMGKCLDSILDSLRHGP